MINYPRRPPRLERIVPSLRPFYFVTCNTYRRKFILANPAIHIAFTEYCREAERRGVAVGRYVIMPNHMHLFVVLPNEGILLSRWFQGLKAKVGKELLLQGFPRPHWQEGFFDHLMRSGDSYSEKWNYVRMNPVRAGLCNLPEAWPFQGEIVRIEF